MKGGCPRPLDERGVRWCGLEESNPFRTPWKGADQPMTQTRRCSQCKVVKPIASFAWKRKGKRLHSHCRKCQAIWRRAHYVTNSKKERSRVLSRRRDLVAWLKLFKTSCACSRCGENHPATLDFHHLDRAAKEIGINTVARRGWSLARIKREIEKCEVLCSNCHRKLHWDEMAERVRFERTTPYGAAS